MKVGKNSTGGCYAFDGFVLDVAAGELRENGTAVELRPKLFSLLVHLVENWGRVITKQELLEDVWPGVIVSDGVLSRSIAALREVLRDDAREPHVIETISGSGYKFVEPVTVLEASDAPPERRTSDFILIHEGRVAPLLLGENILGRIPECDLQIVATSVSRRHARIEVSAAGAILEDLGSLNGTFVGDRRVDAPTALHEGDEIRIGRERLRFIGNQKVRARTQPM